MWRRKLETRCEQGIKEGEETVNGATDNKLSDVEREGDCSKGERKHLEKEEVSKYQVWDERQTGLN